jgi:hypothetical protein
MISTASARQAGSPSMKSLMLLTNTRRGLRQLSGSASLAALARCTVPVHTGLPLTVLAVPRYQGAAVGWLVMRQASRMA